MIKGRLRLPRVCDKVGPLAGPVGLMARELDEREVSMRFGLRVAAIGGRFLKYLVFANLWPSRIRGPREFVAFCAEK